MIDSEPENTPEIIIDTTAESVLSPADTAAEIATEALKEVQQLREDTNQAWQNQVISTLENLTQLVQNLQTAPPQAAQPEMTTELTIEEPESVPEKVRQSNKGKRTRRLQRSR